MKIWLTGERLTDEAYFHIVRYVLLLHINLLVYFDIAGHYSTNIPCTLQRRRVILVERYSRHLGSEKQRKTGESGK